jgi:hypothetical protein
LELGLVLVYELVQESGRVELELVLVYELIPESGRDLGLELEPAMKLMQLSLALYRACS